DDAFARVLSLRIARGRWFEAPELVPGGPAVVILTHKVWTESFGADPSIVGKPIVMDGTSRLVVGVLAPGSFNYPDTTAGLIVPLRVVRGSGADTRTCLCYGAIARLRPSVSLSAGRAELKRINAQINAEVGK